MTNKEAIDRLFAALNRGSDHSTVKLTRNAKGDVQIEVSVRTDDSECMTVDEAASKACEVYDQLAARYPNKEATP